MRALTNLLPLALACSTQVTHDSGDLTPADSGDAGADATTPLEGIYTLWTEVSSNDCGDQAALRPELTSTVSSASDTSYTLLIEQPEENLLFTCSLSDGAFTCSAETSEDYASWGWAAVLNFSHVMTGSWSSADAFEGSISSTTECAGSECAGLAEIIESTFPCTVSHTLSGTQD
jgi:hypothetical protein